MLDKLKTEKLLGLPMWAFLILFAITALIGVMGWLPNNLSGMLAFCIIIGAFTGWFGDKLPFFNKWLGGGIMMAWLAGSLIYTFNLVPESTVNTIVEIGIDSGFRDFCIVMLVVGSIFSIDRKILIKAMAGFIPTACAGLAAALAFGALAAFLVGYNPIDGMLNFALPVMGGGTGAGAVPMSEMWAAATGRDAGIWFAPAFAVLCVADSLAAISAAVLNQLGKKFPKFSGNGQMMRKTPNVEIDETPKEAVSISMADIASGLGLAIFLFIFSAAYAKRISIINNANLGFSIHTFAFLVIFTVVLSVSNILPARVKEGALNCQKFFARQIVFAQMTLLGFTSSFYDFAEMIMPRNLFVIVMVILGAILGTALVGYLLGFYPIEAAVTAGLCMANAGNSGDLMVLGAANRMNLIAFSSVATRIGGAIVLVVGSVLFGLFA